MSEQGENYHFFRPLNSEADVLYVDERWSDDLTKLVESRRVTHLRLRRWKQSDVSFLQEVGPRLRFLCIETASIKDISAVNSLTELTTLWICGDVGQVDFRHLPKLEACEVESTTPEINPWEAPSLMRLSLVGTRISDLSPLGPAHNLANLSLLQVPLKGFAGIEAMGRLRELSLNQAPVAQLRGLAACPSLRRLSLVLLKNLSSLEGIEGLNALEWLDIDTCRKIQSIGPLAALRALRHLELDNLGSFPTLKPLELLSRLEEFSFIESTKIEDGDLSILLKLPRLLEVAFKKWKHYSHTPDEIRDQLKSRVRT